MASVPAEILEKIIQDYLEFAFLRDVIQLRLVSKSFKDTVDHLIPKQPRFFRGGKIHERIYGLRGHLPIHVAANLIECRWGDDSFMSPQFRDLLHQIERDISDAYLACSITEPVHIRKHICDLLARSSSICLRDRPCDEEFLIFGQEAIAICDSNVISQATKDDDCQQLSSLQRLHDLEAFAIAAAVCDVEILQIFMERVFGVCLSTRKSMLATCSKKVGRLRDVDGPNWGVPIGNAAICGRVNNLRLLLYQLEQESFVRQHTELLSNSLILACQNGHVESAQLIKDFIIRHVPREFVTTHEYPREGNLGMRAFRQACINNHLAVAKVFESFLDTTGNEQIDNEFKQDVLCACASRGHSSSLIRYLVSCGAEPDWAGVDDLRVFGSHPPLYGAIWYGHKHVVRTLFEFGICPDLDDLFIACISPVCRDDVDMLELMEEYNINAYTDYPFYGCYPTEEYVALIEASYNRCFKSVEFLVKRNPQVLENGMAQGAIEETVDHRDLTMAQLLLTLGANIRGEKGRNVLFIAVERGNKDLCELLLDHGADPNGQYWYQTRNGRQSMSAVAIADYGAETCSPLDRFLAVSELLRSRGGQVLIDPAVEMPVPDTSWHYRRFKCET